MSPQSECAHRGFIRGCMQRERNTMLHFLLPLEPFLVPSKKPLRVMQEVSSCTTGHKPTHPHLQNQETRRLVEILQKTQTEGERRSRSQNRYEPPPSNVANFSAGKTETFSSSNLYQSSSSSSIVLWSGSVAWLAFGWKTLFLANPI